MSQDKLLEVKNLKVSFRTYAGTVQAVRGVSWHLEKKETIAIVGESGCGKTATIQTIMGLNMQNPICSKEGQVVFDGKDLLTCSEKQMRDIQGNDMSIIFQDPFTFLNPTMKVGDQVIEVYCRHHKATRREATERLLEMMRLISLPDPEKNIKRYPHQLSGGQRQRIMIAMALICGPKILFADEPTTALDVTIQAQIIELMKHLKEQIDTSIVLITHDLGVVANMANRVYMMYAGQIVEHADARTIFKNSKHPYTRALLGSVPRVDQKTEGGLFSIPGSPPDLIDPPTGCAFAARCSQAMNICKRLQPPEITFPEPEHKVCCWLHHPEYKARKKAVGVGERHE